MPKNSSVNLEISNDADGFSVAGGTVKRSIAVSGGDVELSGGGGFTYSFPGQSGTLALLTDITNDTDVIELSSTAELLDSYSGKIIQCTGTFTLTVGNRPVGFNCLVVNIGTGVITLAPGSGVTLHTKGDAVTIAEDDAVTVYRQATNVMRAIGGLT
jgi:hypothetical protein